MELTPELKSIGLSHGNYFMENYAGANRDFVVRAGAVMRKQLLTPEQFTEVYRSMRAAFDRVATWSKSSTAAISPQKR